MEIQTFRAMNSEIVLLAESEAPQAEAGFVAARNFIEASERRFTRFSEDSELSGLNRSAGRWFQVSPDLFEVVREALFYFHRTKGLFDPSILPSLRQAGYVHSMDEIRRVGAAPQAASQPPASAAAFGSIELQEADLSIRLPAGMQIDLGGIAKGWIAERAARLLSRYASACAVSAGGDMFLIGYPDGQDFWEVGLEDPRNPQADLVVLELQEGA
ncbi:MAG TPA: FAD:protein FMN transferase, partial [Anaerolineales bacterium]|nr:FAD:protein FMN transferase [Anaerolineales bacterium]